MKYIIKSYLDSVDEPKEGMDAPFEVAYPPDADSASMTIASMERHHNTDVAAGKICPECDCVINHGYKTFENELGETDAEVELGHKENCKRMEV